MKRAAWLAWFGILLFSVFSCNTSKSDDSTVPSSGINANFAATPQWGDAPLTVQFTDTSISTQGIASWSWDFGDGGTSTEQHPMCGYTAEGSYDVSLTVTGPEGNDSETKIGFITVSAAAGNIAAGFTALPTSGAKPLDVQFTDISTSASGITSWSWDFGDGGTSTTQSPLYQYTTEGTYTVSLTVSGTDGSDSETKTDFIQVAASGEITAEFFAATSPTGNEPLTVQFTDTSYSTSGINTWSWDFGDSGTSSAQFPQHTFEYFGTYTVSLTVTGPDGSDTETKADYVTANFVQGTAPELDISQWVQGGPYTIAGLRGKVVFISLTSPST